MTTQPSVPTSEFPRPVTAAKVTPSGTSERIEATETERSRLARRLDLVSVESVTATVRLRRIRGEMIRVEGALEADVVQSCVVTLDPVPAHVSERFTALFAPDHLLPKEAEVDLDMDFFVTAADLEEDVPEAMPGGRIDIGELVTQHLSLALDPYPRKPGVVFDEIAEDSDEDRDGAKKPNPFAVLAPLKRPT